jgi:hypothetical protein
MSKLNWAWEWVKARWAERSTWDGTILVGMGVMVLIASPFLKYAAMAAIGYGAFRIWQEEKQDANG